MDVESKHSPEKDELLYRAWLKKGCRGDTTADNEYEFHELMSDV